MLFNPDASKQVEEIVFSRKKNPSNHYAFYFNNMPLKRKNTQKHLGLYLDAKLNFSEHIKEKIKKSHPRYYCNQKPKRNLTALFPINNF